MQINSHNSLYNKRLGGTVPKYFDYLARNYPVMCLSDEFYFFPRVKKAANYLDILDCLDKQKLKADISYVKNLKAFLGGINLGELDLEAQIDLALLNQSMSTFLREFAEVKIWQSDPTLYLKILLLGTDQLVRSLSLLKHDFGDNLRARIAQGPRLLNEAKSNLKNVPLDYLEVALELVEVAIDYFKTTALAIENNPALLKEINALTKKTLHALEDFKRFLIKRPAAKSFLKDKHFLESVLKDTFSYHRGLEELFDIASAEYQHTIRMLNQIAEHLKPGQSWQQILSGYRLEAKDGPGLLALYSKELRKLEAFLKKKDVITIPRTQNILVEATPQFMRPVRASASYSAPITTDRREPGYFYISTDFAASNNIHNEYIFVSAHEAYPGHHLLDSIRRRLKDPIRRQIESPLFYEGWASYAERLIDRLGYIEHPLQRLVGLKRQAWRAVRAMLDVGVRIERLKIKDAQELLRGLGYGPRIVKSMLRHYLLHPGYQLCYTIGKFEIERLAKRFVPRLGLKRFHDLLLQGGQLPFDLVAKRLEREL